MRRGGKRKIQIRRVRNIKATKGTGRKRKRKYK